MLFLPELAMSLNNLGNRLKELGRPKGALQANQEAIQIYRQLAAGLPDVFLPFVARSPNNLGPMLSDLGHHEYAA